MDRVQLRSIDPPGYPYRVHYADVIQGKIDTCAIAAIMVAIAHTRPRLIGERLPGEPRTGVVLSKRAADEIYKYWSDVTYWVRFTTGLGVLVTPVLYYHGQYEVAYASTLHGPGWPSLVEKAYAILKGNSYNNLDRERSLRPVPSALAILTDLVGPSDTADLVSDSLINRWKQSRALKDSDLIRIADQARHRPTVATSYDHGTQDGITAGHTYAVIRWRRGRMILHNPTGSPDVPQLTLDQLRASFSAVHQAL
ncbi:hypothetical protein [Nocardia amamiensis]|uniref:hypothetical protein n=1 Tax=Nocardia amamiensis TaxID=404578 RepID=UPI001471768D|nr:hypothetical protein [Nocardia amamiensis]